VSVSSRASLLKLADLQVAYGQREAVFDAQLRIDEGEIVALVGHNGAGKTTTMKAAFGLLQPRAGTVRFAGEDIVGATTEENVRRGMRFVPEDDFVFRQLAVDENLILGGFAMGRQVGAGQIAEVYEQFPVLEARKNQRAGTLSGGERRMLSLGMAMISNPRLLMLDEPSLGLAPVLVQQVMDVVRGLAEERDLSVLMVEQNIDQALRVADRVYVMRAGRIFLEETAEEMRARDDWWDLF
jgi:branched-chain amino acid transport system ATP-binding protein